MSERVCNDKFETGHKWTIGNYTIARERTKTARKPYGLTYGTLSYESLRIFHVFRVRTIFFLVRMAYEVV